MKTIACNCEKQTWHVIKKVLCSKHKKIVLCQPQAALRNGGPTPFSELDISLTL